jgi:hypothetical protein
MTGSDDDVPSTLKSLWDLEGELRSAAQSAIFLRNAEASQHLAEARRHFDNALKAVKSKPADSTSSPDPRDGTPPSVK